MNEWVRFDLHVRLRADPDFSSGQMVPCTENVSTTMMARVMTILVADGLVDDGSDDDESADRAAHQVMDLMQAPPMLVPMPARSH